MYLGRRRRQQGEASPRRHRLVRRVKKLAILLISLPLAYLLAVLVGMVPANSAFRHAPDGIDIYIVSNGVHTDIVVPTLAADVDWAATFPVAHFDGIDRPSSHVRFGWGDRVFYIETPTWGDLRVSNLLRAMFWISESVMHVEYVSRPTVSQRCRKLSLTGDQYRRLVKQLRGCFHYSDGGRPQHILEAQYGPFDAFYLGVGNYHLLNTCNCWTGKMLRGAGVRCGIWTPSTVSVMWTLPAEEEKVTSSDGAKGAG